MTINKIVTSSRFRRDIKKLNKKHYSISKVIGIINIIRQGKMLFLKRRFDDHALHGNLQGYRELHVEPDLLLLYKIYSRSTLGLARCTSHDRLFK